MFELNRLKPMPEVYDKSLFNKLYGKTENLRKKLARQIDPNRFGVTYEDILAAFDVKFIFVFEKNHERSENELTARMLNALQNFKCRILRSAYTIKYSQKIMQVENVLTLEDYLMEDHPVNSSSQNNYFNEMMDFMKNYLSDNAYSILEIKLNPPPYIQSKLNMTPDSNIQKIPDHIILDYFGLGTGKKAYKYLNTLKKEISNAVNCAKAHFSNS